MFRSIANDNDQAVLLRLAQEELRTRRDRVDRFGRSLFSDQAWDILLALYLKDEGCTPAAVAEFIGFADVSVATLTRWLQSLCERDLVRLVSSPDDRGTVVASLSRFARNQMDAYFIENAPGLRARSLAAPWLDAQSGPR